MREKTNMHHPRQIETPLGAYRCCREKNSSSSTTEMMMMMMMFGQDNMADRRERTILSFSRALCIDLISLSEQHNIFSVIQYSSHHADPYVAQPFSILQTTRRVRKQPAACHDVRHANTGRYRLTSSLLSTRPSQVSKADDICSCAREQNTHTHTHT